MARGLRQRGGGRLHITLPLRRCWTLIAESDEKKAFDSLFAALPAFRRPSGDAVPRHPLPKAIRPLGTKF